jgi:hypothetical protein
MFDDLFKKIGDFIGEKVQEAAKDLEKRFAMPEPGGAFVSIRKFAIADKPYTQGGVSIVDDSWRIEAYDDNAFRLNNEPLRKLVLFEIEPPPEANCLIACRFQAKAQASDKSINVQLSLCQQRQLVTTATARSIGVSTTESFRTFEILTHYKESDNPTKIQIVVEFESSGILQIKDLEILKAPVKESSESTG